MTTRNFAPSASVPITLFYGPEVRDRREGLSSELAAIDGLSITTARPLSALGGADTDRPILIVSDTPPPTPLPDRQTVWVTTDAGVAEAVAGEAAVVHWGFEHDRAMLATRLRAEFDTADTDTDPGVHRAAVRAHRRTDDVVLALDADHRLTYVDERAAELLDTPAEAVRGDRLWDHVPDAVAADLRPSVERAMAAGDQVTTPFELDDGTTVREATVYPGPDGVTLRTQDVEDGFSPSLYEYLVETVGDAVYILDDEGNFVFVNDALCEMTGYSRDELLGSSVHIIKDGGTVGEAEDALRELLKTRVGSFEPDDGISIAKLDVELVRKDDTRVPCTDRMTLRPLEDGEFTGTVGTLRDVSRQRRRVDILNGLVERSRAMMSATETEAVIDMIVSAATDVFGLDLVALRMYDPDVDGLVPVRTSDALDEALGDRPVYGTDDGPVGTAFATGELVTRDDLEATPGSAVTAVDHGAYLPIGEQYVLSLGHSADEGFDSVTLGLLEVFGETVAAALERVTREEHLEQYEAIVEAAEDMLFTVDDSGEFTLVTRPFAQLLGYGREELVGRRLDEFLPDDTDDALSPGDRVVLETEFRGSGDAVPSRLALAPFEDGLIGTVRDISQLKSAQREASRQRRRFVELFETLSDPVADVSYRDGVARVEGLNPAFARLCDREPDSLKRGTLVAAQEALPDALARTLDPVRSPSPSLDTTVTTQTPAGKREYLVRTAPYESGGTDRAFVFLTDVTELSRRGTQLKVLHRILRHNLRNETSLIRGHAEQLRQLPLPAGADDHIDKILDASNELVGASETSQTVQRVLGFEPDEIEAVPADRALDRLRSHLDGSVEPADTEITVTTDTEVAVPFSQYLLIVLRELVENAIKHDPATQVTVRTTVRDGAVRIAVTDDGDGLPEAHWDLLTGDREITQLQHGDGLGLWLVKWVTNRHGGYLELPKAGADGTTVELVFPDAA